MYWDKVVSGATSLDRIRWIVQPFFLFVSRSFLCSPVRSPQVGGDNTWTDVAPPTQAPGCFLFLLLMFSL